jgi:hypothetical protein
MVLHFAHQDVLDPVIDLSCRESRVAADTRVSLTWLLLSRGVLEARLRLNPSSGLAFSADTEVWFPMAGPSMMTSPSSVATTVCGERPERPRAPKRASPLMSRPPSVCCTRPGVLLAAGATHWPHRGAIMSDKSPRQHMAKKQGKTIKEKRADKRDKANAAASIDPVSRAAKR